MSQLLEWTPAWYRFRRLWIAVAVLLVLLLALLWWAGYGPGGAACQRALLASGACADPAASGAPVFRAQSGGDASNLGKAAAAAPAASTAVAADPAMPADPPATAAVAAEPASPAATEQVPEPTDNNDLPGDAVVATMEPDTAQASAPAPTATPKAPAPVKLYFELGQFDLPTKANARLADLLAYLKERPSAQVAVSGFHDPQGPRAKNQLLALNRARAVADLLEKSGVQKQRIVLQKPTQTLGGGEPKEARRVEVSVLPQ